jgi:hypothetical protein
MPTTKRKPAAKKRPAATTARPSTNLAAFTWLLVGMAVYGVGIDARHTTWPAAAAGVHLGVTFVHSLGQDDAQLAASEAGQR